MLDLPSVTLLCVDCVFTERSIPVLERCKTLCNFGAVKLLTSVDTDYQHKVKIDHIPSHNGYSIFMLKRVHEFIDTPHMLVVQHDGWILHPESWNPMWLEYDYIAPLFIQYNIVGSGGFSMRSKRLMSFVSSSTPHWDGTPEGTARLQYQLDSYEDGIISITLRSQAEAAGFKYASLEEAAKFAYCCNDYLKTPKPFGFHRWTNSLEADVLSLS